MPRRCLRGAEGFVFHVMNRGVRRLRLFDAAEDYQTFLMSLQHAHAKHPLHIFAYCVMPNHFHLMVQPTTGLQLVEFMRLMQQTHAKRWHKARRSSGEGAVYQGRYRAFVVGTDAYFLRACRYVEQNALRAGLVRRAEDWVWGSLSQRCRNLNVPALAAWPILQPTDWMDHVNELPIASELVRLRDCVGTNLPFGPESWTKRIMEQLQLEPANRRRGRPAREK